MKTIGELRLKRAPRVKRAPPLAAPSSGLVNVAYDTEHQTNMLNIHKCLHCNRNLQTSKAPLKSQAQGTSLFTSATSNQRGCSKEFVGVSGPLARG